MTQRSRNLTTRYNQPSFIALQELQNTSKFDNVDIVSITGFMRTEEEVTAHYETMLAR